MTYMARRTIIQVHVSVPQHGLLVQLNEGKVKYSGNRKTDLQRKRTKRTLYYIYS